MQLGIHEWGQLERPTNGQHILFGEDQFGDPLPIGPLLPLPANAGHILDRLANGEDRAAVFGQQGRSRFWERYSGRNNMPAKCRAAPVESSPIRPPKRAKPSHAFGPARLKSKPGRWHNAQRPGTSACEADASHCR
jgi:hypothetical protein